MNFINKTYQSYQCLKISEGFKFFGKVPSIFEKKFFKQWKAWELINTDNKIHTPLKELNQEIIIGEFNLLQLKQGTGPSGEIIIDEPKKEIFDDIFFEFLNLSNDQGEIQKSEVLNFAKKYGLLTSQPMEYKLINDRYHAESLSFWRYEISLMNSLIKTYYNYQENNIEDLKKLFKQSKKEFSDCFYRDNTYANIKSNNLKNNIEVYINFHDMVSPSGNFLVEEIYEQLFVDVLFQVLNKRLMQTTDTFLIAKEESGEFRKRDQRWIEVKSGYKNLLSFIWVSFAFFIEQKYQIKICKNEKCNKYFKSQKMMRAKFHNDICRSAYARDMKIWEIAQDKFLTEDLVMIDERRLGIGIVRTFDAIMINKKNNIATAMVEFKYSNIDQKSQKWNYIKNQIYENLNHLYRKYRINHAFLINKNGKLFEWNIEKKINGVEINKLPATKKMVQSKLVIDKAVIGIN